MPDPTGGPAEAAERERPGADPLGGSGRHRDVMEYNGNDRVGVTGALTEGAQSEVPAPMETLDRVRALLDGRAEVVEKRMVGGRSFSYRERMFCGVNSAGLVVRVRQETRDAALAEPHVLPLVIGGRQPLGFVVVEPAGLPTDAVLAAWVERGLAAVGGPG